jgi:NitT/TauT family transport system substrate-binding protein
MKFPAKRLILFAFVAVLWVVGCSSNSSTSSPQQPIISGVNPWPGYAGHYVALKQDLFGKAGVKVQESYFQSATEGITGFLAKKTDVAWVTSGDAIQMIAKDPTIKIIYLVDYSDGSDGILGHNIAKPQDLKGKTIAREDILFENVLLQAYLAKGGLTDKDVELKSMTAADAAAAFAAKRVDAAVSYEPWLTKAAKQSGGKVIFTTKGTNLIADVIVARQDTLEKRKTELQAYFKAVDQGVKLVNEGNPEALNIVAEKLGVKLDEAKEQLSGVKIFDLDGNKSIGFNLSNPNNMIKNLELTAKGAFDFKLASKPLEVNSLYDESVLKSVS